MPIPEYLQPADELGIMSLRFGGVPMNEDLDESEYDRTVIGFALSDPEACESIIEIASGEGMAADIEIAEFILDRIRIAQ